MAYPPITSLGTVPQRTQTPAEFATNADSFLGALPNFRTELNTFGAYVDAAGVAIDADAAAAANSALQAQNSASASDASAALALSYKDLAAGTANFKGSWSALTGSLAVPASVYHNGLTWVLLSNLANVTTAEPGISASWVVASGDSYQRLVDNILKRATLDLDFSANSHKVYEQFGLEPKQLQSVIVTSRNSTATYQSPTAIVTAAINAPRITYDAATDNALGLLVEEQRTNLLLHSQYTAASGETPPTGWSDTGTDTGTTTTAASMRFTGAIRATQTGTAQRECWNQTLTLSAATTYTFSAYFAKGTASDGVVLRVTTPDTPTGTLTLAGSAVTSAGTYSITFTTVAGGSYQFQIGLGCAGNATGTVIHETPQLEVGAFPTSYIPTTTAQVTRLAAFTTIPNLAELASTLSEYTIVVQGKWLDDTVAFGFGNTFDNCIYFSAKQFNIRSGGVSGPILGVPHTTDTLVKYAVRVKSGDFAAAVNGAVTGTSSSSIALPVGMVRATIGSAPWDGSATLANSANGTFSRITFIPRGLTNAELQAITA